MTLSMSPAEALGRVPSTFCGIAIQPEAHMVGRPCACGQYVWADPADPAPGVAAHNRTAEHRAWWAWAEMEWQGEV